MNARSKKSCGTPTKKGVHALQDNAEWLSDIQEAKTYYPTPEEFKNPFKYLAEITPEASKYGICKIVPPVKAEVPAGKVLSFNSSRYGFKFTTNVQQLGVYRCSPNAPKLKQNKFYKSGREYTLQTFQEMANQAMTKKFGCSGSLPTEYVEKEFWKEMAKFPNTKQVEYGSDIDGSAFSENYPCALANSAWNLRNFPRCPESLLRYAQSAIPGVTEPMLYCGMLFSVFAWHVEDSFLNSINFHHLGAPKIWYGVPADFASQFDKIASEFVFKKKSVSSDSFERDMDASASMFMLKTTMFSPKVLTENNVKVFKVIQNPGEFVLTFPQAYHGGFSTGFNLGEAVNFATRDWYPFGYRAEQRYERLKKYPVISLEEMLYREYQHSEDNGDTSNMEEHAFALLKNVCDEYATLLDSFKDRIKSLMEMPASNTSLPCNSCKRLCFLVMALPDNEFEPICLKCTKKVSIANPDLQLVLFAHSKLEDLAKCLSTRCAHISGNLDLNMSLEALLATVKKGSKTQMSRAVYTVASDYASKMRNISEGVIGAKDEASAFPLPAQRIEYPSIDQGLNWLNTREKKVNQSSPKHTKKARMISKIVDEHNQKTHQSLNYRKLYEGPAIIINGEECPCQVTEPKKVTQEKACAQPWIRYVHRNHKPKRRFINALDVLHLFRKEISCKTLYNMVKLSGIHELKLAYSEVADKIVLLPMLDFHDLVRVGATLKESDKDVLMKAFISPVHRGKNTKWIKEQMGVSPIKRAKI